MNEVIHAKADAPATFDAALAALPSFFWVRNAEQGAREMYSSDGESLIATFDRVSARGFFGAVDAGEFEMLGCAGSLLHYKRVSK